MNQQALIEVTERQIGGEMLQTVNARDLHAFLGVGKDFSSWMSTQLVRARMVTDRNYVKVPQKGELGGQTKIEYFLTIEVAKHVSMMSRTKKGIEVRDYFIECERRVKNATTFNIPTTLSGALRLAADQAELIEMQAAQIESQKPAVEFVERYSVADGLKGVREVAKLLHVNERVFVGFLMASGIMYRLNGRLMPIAHHQHASRFEVKTGVGDNEHAFTQAMFTPKGISWIAAEWNKYQMAIAA